MFNFRVFTEFSTASSADRKDRLFLQDMRKVRETTGARYVNFSLFDYRTEIPETIHFLTYPTEWISHYLRHSYAEIDPILNVDFRRANIIDWRQAHAGGPQAMIFDRMAEFGLGNDAVSVVCHASDKLYCALSLIFRCEPLQWPDIKRERMDEFKRQQKRLFERYHKIYRDNCEDGAILTPREQQVLSLAAEGYTDEAIADLMGIGRWTVVGHMQSARFKLGCVNRTAVVAKAIAQQLIKPKLLP